NNDFSAFICEIAVDDDAQSIDFLIVQQNIHLNKVAFLISYDFIIKRCISFSIRFELVKEIKYDFGQRDFIYDVYPYVVQVIHRDEVTPLLLTELHYSTDIIIRHHYLCFNIRLFNTIDFRSEEHTSELQSRFDLVC